MNLTEIGNLNEDSAIKYFERIRWPMGLVCIKCGETGQNVIRIVGKSARPGLLQCKSCRKQFSVTVGTVFQGSHIPLNKWFMAIHLMCSSKKGISALQLKRNLGISYKSAFHLAHRIRYAMKKEPLNSLLCGPVECDETYIGARRKRGSKRGRGGEHKTPVFALVERNGSVRTKVVERVDSKTLKQAIKDNVHRDATIFTDEWRSYKGIGKSFIGGHKTVNHGEGQYVNPETGAYTNTAESFFALLKRGVYGSFHHVSKHHLHRYCDEFSFRWNLRDVSDFTRTEMAIRQAEGKMLMYKEPIKRVA